VEGAGKLGSSASGTRRQDPECVGPVKVPGSPNSPPDRNPCTSHETASTTGHSAVSRNWEAFTPGDHTTDVLGNRPLARCSRSPDSYCFSASTGPQIHSASNLYSSPIPHLFLSASSLATGGVARRLLLRCTVWGSSRFQPTCLPSARRADVSTRRFLD
jgi:hypothetical protein